MGILSPFYEILKYFLWSLECVLPEDSHTPPWKTFSHVFLVWTSSGDSYSFGSLDPSPPFPPVDIWIFSGMAPYGLKLVLPPYAKMLPCYTKRKTDLDGREWLRKWGSSKSCDLPFEGSCHMKRAQTNSLIQPWLLKLHTSNSHITVISKQWSHRTHTETTRKKTPNPIRNCLLHNYMLITVCLWHDLKGVVSVPV